MPPLIVHNVPEDERYVGEDGIRRPYAILYPPPEGTTKPKKSAPETGSFGKSSSRARPRSKTGTPVAKKQDPTIEAGDAIFASYFQNQTASPERKASNAPAGNDVTPPSKPETHVRNVPTEVILRGYKSSHQYAAIKTYEIIAGRICEDYPRDPPLEQRRLRADIREAAAVRQQRLTAEERVKASRFAGGEHWIKVTFESSEAAEKAVASSPQIILGHHVFADLYRGMPPREDVAYSEQKIRDEPESSASPIKSPTPAFASTGPKRRRDLSHPSPSDSQTSSQTIETATLSTATVSSATVTGIPDDSPSLFNRKQRRSPSQTSQSSPTDMPEPFQRPTKLPPGVKPCNLLPASQALLPRPSPVRRMLSQLPLGGWLSHDIIGSQVPRTESGDFDWRNASVYWKMVYLLDRWLGFQNGDVAGRDMDYEKQL